MQTSGIDRDDPCPCGSGRQFRHCCLGREDSAPPRPGATHISGSLRDAHQGRQFDSLEEAQAFVTAFAQRENRRALDDFQGLSPEQMHCVLYLPFASPDLVRIPEVLDASPSAPILKLFCLLADAIGAQGLKPTAKGNLPRKVCREAALAYWGEATHRERTRFGDIHGEADFDELHTTRLVAELAGLIRRHRGRLILGRDCRRLLAGDGLGAIYPRLFRAYVERFNWAYRDGYPELGFIQRAFLFTLYLLARHGGTWRPQRFYEDAFLRAFPMILNEAPSWPLTTPEETVRRCYSRRTLMQFAGFLGLAAVEPVAGQFPSLEYRVQALPLLARAVVFQHTG